MRDFAGFNDRAGDTRRRSRARPFPCEGTSWARGAEPAPVLSLTPAPFLHLPSQNTFRCRRVQRSASWRSAKSLLHVHLQEGHSHARLAGPAVSAGRDLGRRGRQLRPLLRARHQGRAVPVRLGRRDQGDRSASRCPSRPTRSGTATCPTCCPASSTATASTARTSRRKGHRFNPNKVAARPVRQGDRPRPAAGTTRCSATRSATRQADLSFDERDSAAFAPLAAVVDTAFTWGDDRPPRTPWHKTLIYELHVKGFTKRHPGRAREAARHLRRPGLRGGHRAPARPGRHRRRAAAGAPSRRRPAPGREGAGELLGLQHARLLRPGAALRRRRASPRDAVQRVQDDGPRAARGRHRGHPRRGLQPHRRGQPARARRCRLRGIDNAALLPAVARRPALLHGLHRLRQHAQHAAPARAAAHHGQPALLGAGDARRRLPLRPGQHAGPRAVRGRQAGRVLRHHPPGPGPVAGQADRRAVGRRRGRLPGRQLPRRCWTEWNGKYRDSVRRFWKGDGGTVSEFATRLAGSQRPLRAERPAARTPASTSSPATTASRCTTWSATTTSTTRPTARTTATAPTTTTAGTAASKGRPTTPTIIALRERQKRNLIATLLLSQGVPMLLAGDELGHTQNGNNNAYCQDNELTWLDWELDERAAGVPRVRAAR